MNDLAGLRLLPELHQAGIASLKIEGRLRSAQYVDGVVRGYRLVLDEFAERREVRKETMAAAEEFLRQAMGRKTTTGYFSTARPAAIISPQHSGNTGMYVGRVEKMIGKEQARIQLKTGLACGDRLRLHHEQSGERVAFTVKEMLVKSRAVQEAAAGARVDVLLPRPFAIGDSLYKVDSKAGRSLERGRRAVAPQSFEKKIAALRARLPVREILRTLGYAETGSYKPQAKAAGAGSPVRTGGRGKGVAPPLKIWVKTDDPQLLKYRFPFPVEQLVLALDREVFERFTRMKNLRIDSRRIVWALPPIIQEDEVSSYTAVIGQLKRQGFVNFQLGHISQLQFFQDRLRVVLTADYTLNVLNSLALLALQEYGVQRGQASIETDKENLRRLAGHAGLLKRKTALGLTVYGTPALFTSRVAADHFRFGSTIVSPKDERFILRQAYGLTVVVAEQPFSLLPMLTELADLGLSYAVVDLCHQKLKGADLELLAKRIAGAPAGRRLSTFNYQGTLL
jgi:putative protease